VFDCAAVTGTQMLASQQQQQQFPGAEYSSSSVLLQRTGNLPYLINHIDSR